MGAEFPDMGASAAFCPRLALRLVAARRPGSLCTIMHEGVPLPPKTCAREKMSNRSVSKCRIADFFTPLPMHLSLIHI